MLSNLKLLLQPGRLFLGILFLLISLASFSQNDNCTNASIVNISNNGFGMGVFNSSINSISAATIESGETFAPAIVLAGQTQKSVWYKFSIPTTRTVRVTLAQSGTGIPSGDAGFAIYKTNACLPGVSSISTKLTPIGLFGSSFHPCIEQGDYLVQVSAKSSANGNVFIQVEIGSTTSAYDYPNQAYDFGTITEGVKTVFYPVDCQSIEDATEVCTSLGNYQQYNKSTWHVFKTAAYFDYVAFFLSYKNVSVSQTFGYKLYRGDVRINSFPSLPVIGGCDSLLPTNFAARKFYTCEELNTNTIYSIQLFSHQNFNDSVQVTLVTAGTAAAHAPEPILSAIPPSNNLGILPSSSSGVTTTSTDYHACNGRHSLHPCSPSLPAAGVDYNGEKYNISSFFIFNLATTANLSINASQIYCGQNLLLRLYKQPLSNSCATLDTINIISQFEFSNNNLPCLDPGNYTLQVLGYDSLQPVNTYNSNFGDFSTSSTPFCGLTGLGQKFTLNIHVKTSNSSSQYSLNVPGAFDTLHAVGGVMQSLVNGITYASIDTFGCANTVLPWDTVCFTANKKAMYRGFSIADSGIISLYNSSPPLNNTWSKLYLGDANALSIAQNVHDYPSRINGLVPYSQCIQYNYECEGLAKVCAIPGTYTYVTFGADINAAQGNRVEVQVNTINTIHESPANAENMGDILSFLPASGGTVQSAIDYFSCRDNAVPINGYIPCNIFGQPGTKAIYRQFYLNAPANISITGLTGCGYKNGFKTLFSGKATDGINGLSVLPAQWQCFTTTSNGNCSALPAGWYTLVCYGIGSSYANQPQNQVGSYQTYVGIASQVTISVSFPCAGPKYNRPYKAAIDTTTGLPFLLQWGPRLGSTAAYPKTDTTYTLYRENYNCIVDTPFITHPIPACSASMTKVTYYVFRTIQESYLSINTENYFGSVYPGNARTDSSSFPTANPIQPCLQSNGQIQICRLQPGTYTLVIFASNTNNCNSVVPKIYIDQVGNYSRFDYANNSYDFGTIPPDSIYHNGKTGDVNPFNASRAPSNDFIYCTTGAGQSDPFNNICAVYNSNIYNTTVNNYLFSQVNSIAVGLVPRRNLWYTFVVDKPGIVRVKVSNKTIDKQQPFKFSVYESNVNGSLPFSNVVNTGQVDSTIAQGLRLITGNPFNGCTVTSNEAIFYRDCSPLPFRYYIVVDNPTSFPDLSGGMHPNSQLEVSILFDSINVIYAGDFCSNPITASLSGAGTNTSTVTVDCHSIGTDYGEYNPILTCPAGATTTEYKTSWFKIDITGTDTLDVTTYLTENTNANPSDIKYRLMIGNCGAMQERSCVQDAQTQDTYKCLPPGSYYMQVFTPVRMNISPNLPVNGTIDLHLSAVLHADTCATINSCLSNADFISLFDCNNSDLVTFVNYSSFGTAVQYNWDFGYNGQTSTEVASQFSYPILPVDQTYTVSLAVLNTGCGGQSTYSLPVIIPARPRVELGNDTMFCNLASVLILDATSWSGASYQWQDGSANNTYAVNNPGLYWVKVTYANCSKRDSIRVFESTVVIDSINATICAGQFYTLPWGAVVNATGIYYDTLYNSFGCDSVRRAVNLTLTAAAVSSESASICPGETYTLPWGIVVNTIGIYSDTLRTNAGCDSLIRKVDLGVKQVPVLSVNKSNDIDCLKTFANLAVSGASNYIWSPASTLNDPFINNPIASPVVTTMYYVTATASNGCLASDSIEVKVFTNNQQNGYLVPSSFTPNNDGLNDCFGVPYWNNVGYFRLSIYNRWGELLFYTANPKKCWNGTYKGKQQIPGTYVYMIKANNICGQIFRKGTVVLIR